MPKYDRSVQGIVQRIGDHGWATLAANARNGYHTMPDGWLTAYDAMMDLLAAEAPADQLLAQHQSGDLTGMVRDDLAGIVQRNDLNYVSPDMHQSALTADWKAVRAVAGEKLLREFLHGQMSNGQRDTIITEHTRPALVERLAQFTADLDTIGRYVDAITPPRELLDEPKKVRDAYTRYSDTFQWYTAIRTSWATCYGPRIGIDSHGARSLLAEIANVPDLAPDWAGSPPGWENHPWPREPKQRLAWLVRNGGQLWTPTHAEHDAAYDRYYPLTGKGNGRHRPAVRRLQLGSNTTSGHVA